MSLTSGTKNIYRMCFEGSSIFKDITLPQFCLSIHTNNTKVWNILLESNNPKIEEIFEDQEIIERIKQISIKLQLFLEIGSFLIIPHSDDTGLFSL